MTPDPLAAPDPFVAQEPFNERRREEIRRAWRDAEPTPLPLLAAQQAWTLTLSVAPSAPPVMDDRRVYVPLQQGQLVALDRERGVHVWTRTIDTRTTPLVVDGTVFLTNGATVRALDAASGRDLWHVALDAEPLAPLVWDTGWLLATLAPRDVVALRAADGHVVWRRTLEAAPTHAPVPGGHDALFYSLADSTVVALALADGARLWERALPGTLSPPAVARDRVYVGSTDNAFYALSDRTGEVEWRWRGGGDVIGAAAQDEVVYFASLDNIIRAVNRGNGNQRWRRPTGTRPVLPPLAFGGVVVLAGLSPTITVFDGETGTVMGTHVIQGELMGAPLIDTRPRPLSVAIVTVTREGVVEALRPTALMFNEAVPTPLTGLPGRSLGPEPAP